MSRSYKKNPYYTDGSVKGTKENKRLANKKVRNTKVLPQYNGYKKVSESWDIHDWVSRTTWQEAKSNWEKQNENDYLKKRYPTLKSFYRAWFKIYRMK